MANVTNERGGAYSFMYFSASRASLRLKSSGGKGFWWAYTRIVTDVGVYARLNFIVGACSEARSP